MLDAQLQETSASILQLGILVQTALSQALQAVQDREQALCELVIASDQTIDNLRFEVERLAFQALTLQQPLAERDLRFLSSAPSITTDLERMGDNATGIAELLLRILPLEVADAKQGQSDAAHVAHGRQKRARDHVITEEASVSGLLALGEEAVRVLRETMQAFEHNDAYAARRIWQEDDVVDVRYHLVRHDLMSMLAGMHAIPALQQDARILQRVTYWLWIAHNLERVGDHCTNICERIVFVLEGDGTILPEEPI